MTETFDAAWLELREGTDHRSRAVDLLPPLREWWMAAERSSVVDLGCGTGSNLRYLAPKLPGAQTWTLVDHDGALLRRIESPGGDVRVRPVEGDLAGTGLVEVSRAHLVTASALLDLVSTSWLSAMVDACIDARCGALFALTYDGIIEWSTDDPLDALVREAVNDHQRGDKGLGPALGPTASATAQELFERRGYRTWLSPSVWRLGPDGTDLAHALVDGWAAAAVEQRSAQRDEVHGWATRRQATISGGDFELVVGHHDLLALPVDPRPETS